MSKLQWGLAGARTYETGVDRGVLSVAKRSGVAWSGLMSVNETPSGGDPRGAYLEGYKFYNGIANEEYEATIQALYYPPEFMLCEGIREIHHGLFASHQKRDLFDFSYRTLIGSDTLAETAGYKIHLVYGATAERTERSNVSESTASNLQPFEWKVATVPPIVDGIRPTSHFAIDSRRHTAAKITALENILYGTSSVDSRFPTPQELITMFGG